MFSSDLFCRKNDGLYIRCSIRGNAACSHESRRERECFKPVLGKTAGTIGETSTLAILIGAVILLVFKVIDLRIPLSCLLSFSVFAILFGGHGFDLHFLAAQLCAGGLMLGTFFMATDYVPHRSPKRSDCVWMHSSVFSPGFFVSSEVHRRVYLMRSSFQTFWCL